MKHKNILLVSNDNFEILNVQKELIRNRVVHSLQVAKNGLDALAILMGCSSPQLENYSRTGKVQPDVLLMDTDSPGVNMIELLCIMQKYYSLQKIKVYLISAKPSKLLLPDECSIEGILPKPFSITEDLLDSAKLRDELAVNTHRAWLTMFALPQLKSVKSGIALRLCELKSIFTGVSAAAGLKTAAIFTVVLAGTALLKPEVEKPTTSEISVAPTHPTNPVPTPLKLKTEPIIPITKKETKKNKTSITKKSSTAIGNTDNNSVTKPAVRAFRIHVVEDEGPGAGN